MDRQASANAGQSTLNPFALPSCSPSAITLERQSTTVPKTSKARSFSSFDMSKSPRAGGPLRFEKIDERCIRHLCDVHESKAKGQNDLDQTDPHGDGRVAPPADRSPADETAKQRAECCGSSPAARRALSQLPKSQTPWR